MRRRLVIEEEFGLYHVRADGIDVTAGALDSALTKAMNGSGAFLDLERGVGFPFQEAEMLESLLGRKEGS